MHLLALALMNWAAPVQSNLYQHETVPGQVVTVNLFPSSTSNGYKFSIARRQDGSLPLIFRQHTGGPTLRIWVKLPNEKYGMLCDWDTVSSPPRDGSGLLLREGDYFVSGNWPDHRLVIGGKWITEAEQANHWELKWGATPVETLNMADGTTVSGMPFTVSARQDGALPYVAQKVTRVGVSTLRIYRRQSNGNYTVYSRTPSVLLTEGEYAISANLPPANSPGNYNVLCTGYWVIP